ncbi:hypothetical protein [Spirosoma sp.]|uniref:hypothetical protein n=1 Tax=Spirosoma sp. TaxID=1899569 RepID=UPI0026269C48|nr:hypothetical protein [Spirosoma sp.]
MSKIPFEGLHFGRYKQPLQLREKYRLLINHQINTNAERVKANEPIYKKLRSDNKVSRKFACEFIQIQLWFFKNNTAFFTRWRKNRKKLVPPKNLPSHLFR